MKISALILVYNAIDTIELAIVGALSQKLSCDYEIIIADDCSNDGTQSVIRDYSLRFPRIIRPIFREVNVGGGQNLLTALQSITSDYIALCDGDDYWTYESKLELQLAYLRANPLCDLVWTDIHVHDKIAHKWHKDVFRSRTLITYSDPSDFILNRGFYAPSTWLFNRKVLSLLIDSILKGYVDGTFSVILDLLNAGHLKYLDLVTGVYTKHQNSVTNTPDFYKRYIFCKGIFRIQLDYLRKYKYSTSFKRYLVHRESTRLLCMAICHNDLQFISYISSLNPSLLNKSIVRANNITSLRSLFKTLFHLRRFILDSYQKFSVFFS